MANTAVTQLDAKSKNSTNYITIFCGFILFLLLSDLLNETNTQFHQKNPFCVESIIGSEVDFLPILSRCPLESNKHVSSSLSLTEDS